LEKKKSKGTFGNAFVPYLAPKKKRRKRGRGLFLNRRKKKGGEKKN